MRIIDIHPHIISPDVAAYPRAPLKGKQSDWSKEHSCSHDQMVKEMDEAGVEKSILVQSSTCYGYDNSYVADAIAAHPDRLGGVCSIDALAADAPGKLQYWAGRGFSGVRLFVSGATITSAESWFNDPACFPFWEKAAELKFPVCLQTSWGTLPQVRETLTRFPTVNVILDHLMRPPIDDGAPYEKASPLFNLREHANLYLKLTPVNIKDARQGAASPQSWIARLIEVFGADRIAFGSNFPSSTTQLSDSYAVLYDVARDIRQSDKEFIYGKTALTLYPHLA